MKKKYDIDNNELLFKVDYFSDFSEEEFDKKIDLASKILKECDNRSVFDGWFDYLKENVISKQEAYSFLAWFFNYGGHEIKVLNPYPFLGMLFKKCQFALDGNQVDEDANNSLDTFDSVYVSMLINSGIISADDYSYTNFYTDDKFLKELK